MKIYIMILLTILAVCATVFSTVADVPYTYDTDIKPITDGSCKGCHTFAGSYATITSKIGFVVPEDPDNSELVWRIEGMNAMGNPVNRMPNGGPYLSDNTIQVIRMWITQGAIESTPVGVVEQNRWVDIKKKFAE